MTELLRKLALWLVLFVGLLGVGLWVGHSATAYKYKQEIANDYITKLQAEASKKLAVQQKVDQVSKDYQGQLAALEGSTDRTIADLRADNKRLSVKIKSATGTVQSDGRCLVDGRAELDDQSSKDLIAITQRGDLWIKSLQNTIKVLQNDKEVSP